MTATALTGPGKTPTRRERAARVVDAALNGGLLGAAVAGVAWLAAWLVAGTVFLILIAATLAVIVYALMRGGNVRFGVWGALAVAWGAVLVERWAVQAHGGLWISLAAWLGVVLGARRAGMRRVALPLLAYPLLSAALVVAADESLADPWGVSWLWLAAILGPPIGVRTLLTMKRS